MSAGGSRTECEADRNVSASNVMALVDDLIGSEKLRTFALSIDFSIT